MIVTVIFLALTVEACEIGNINHGDPHEVIRTYLEYCACLLKSINDNQFETKVLLQQLVPLYSAHTSMNQNPLSRSYVDKNMYDQRQTLMPPKTRPVILFPTSSSINEEQRKN